MAKRPHNRSVGQRVDPHTVLGLAPGADAASIVAARRRLAKQLHPDAGGSHEAMQQLNDAADEALAAIVGAAEPRATDAPPRRPPPRDGRRYDHPSFTIEALPAEAFEALIIAASWLGQVADDDPPYVLEVVLDEPAAWCRLDLVPDAGSSTVSVTTARVPGHAVPDVDDVRDRWIAALNQLDWDHLDRGQPRPW